MKPFTFPIEQFQEDGWFFAKCDELPGILLFGPTLEDVESQMFEALVLASEARLHDITEAEPVRPQWKKVRSESLSLKGAPQTVAAE